MGLLSKFIRSFFYIFLNQTTFVMNFFEKISVSLFAALLLCFTSQSQGVINAAGSSLNFNDDATAGIPGMIGPNFNASGGDVAGSTGYWDSDYFQADWGFSSTGSSWTTSSAFAAGSTCNANDVYRDIGFCDEDLYIQPGANAANNVLEMEFSYDVSAAFAQTLLEFTVKGTFEDATTRTTIVNIRLSKNGGSWLEPSTGATVNSDGPASFTLNGDLPFGIDVGDELKLRISIIGGTSRRQATNDRVRLRQISFSPKPLLR